MPQTENVGKAAHLEPSDTSSFSPWKERRTHQITPFVVIAGILSLYAIFTSERFATPWDEFLKVEESAFHKKKLCSLEFCKEGAVRTYRFEGGKSLEITCEELPDGGFPPPLQRLVNAGETVWLRGRGALLERTFGSGKKVDFIGPSTSTFSTEERLPGGCRGRLVAQ